MVLRDAAKSRCASAGRAPTFWNSTTRTLQAPDENGNPITLQVICPP